MSIEILTLIMLGSMVLLLVIGLPLAFVTGLIAFGFALALYGPMALPLIASRVYGFVSVYALIAVPMFVLMASVLERSGIARDLFGAMHVLAGNLKGGLAIQTMAVAVLMAAMTGIIGGEIVLLGLVALPQMLARNYDRNLAIGTVCAGGGLGTMIPPSIVLIFYGLTAEVSIGDLFLVSCHDHPWINTGGDLHCLHINSLLHKSRTRSARATSGTPVDDSGQTIDGA